MQRITFRLVRQVETGAEYREVTRQVGKFELARELDLVLAEVGPEWEYAEHWEAGSC